MTGGCCGSDPGRVNSIRPLVHPRWVSPMKLAQGTTVISNGQLIDGTGAAPVRDAALVITDSRIAYAGRVASAPR